MYSTATAVNDHVSQSQVSSESRSQVFSSQGKTMVTMRGDEYTSSFDSAHHFTMYRYIKTACWTPYIIQFCQKYKNQNVLKIISRLKNIFLQKIKQFTNPLFQILEHSIWLRTLNRYLLSYHQPCHPLHPPSSEFNEIIARIFTTM